MISSRRPNAKQMEQEKLLFIDPAKGSNFGFPKACETDLADFREGRLPNLKAWLVAKGR